MNNKLHLGNTISRNLKIYIGSSSKFIKQCNELSEKLENKLDAIITRKWWKHYIKDKPEFEGMTDIEFYFHPQPKTICELDFKAIRDADIVIIYNENQYKLTGAMIELGYGLALNKITYLVGKFKRSSMLATCIFTEDQDALINALMRFN